MVGTLARDNNGDHDLRERRTGRAFIHSMNDDNLQVLDEEGLGRRKEAVCAPGQEAQAVDVQAAARCDQGGKRDGPKPDETPKDSQQDSTNASRKRPASDDTTSKPRRGILLVEDNLVNQRVLRRQLERTGFDVHVANHGAEALELLRKSRLWRGNAQADIDPCIILMGECCKPRAVPGDTRPLTRGCPNRLGDARHGRHRVHKGDSQARGRRADCQARAHHCRDGQRTGRAAQDGEGRGHGNLHPFRGTAAEWIDLLTAVFTE